MRDRIRSLAPLLRDWVTSIRRYGPLYLGAYLFDVVRARAAERAEHFDAPFGTDTATIIYPWNLRSLAQLQNAMEVHAYETAPAALIREALGCIPLPPARFTFVDLGSGKGRVLLVASELPFARIVGVELSRELTQIAGDNISRYRSASQMCRAFSLHCMNAADYAFPPEPLVLFFYNPFGKETIRCVLRNLEASLKAAPRDAYVIYMNPRFSAVVREAGFLRRMRTGGAWWRPWSRYIVYCASPAESIR
jgi:SAM-dependent methyltransferase